MYRWLPAILKRIRTLAVFGALRLTEKARAELTHLGLDRQDARDVLTRLNAEDFAERIASQVTGERMYVFKPRVGGTIVYVKLILRDACVVVSFHEDGGVANEDAK